MSVRYFLLCLNVFYFCSRYCLLNVYLFYWFSHELGCMYNIYVQWKCLLSQLLLLSQRAILLLNCVFWKVLSLHLNWQKNILTKNFHAGTPKALNVMYYWNVFFFLFISSILSTFFYFAMCWRKVRKIEKI